MTAPDLDVDYLGLFVSQKRNYVYITFTITPISNQ